jgi:secreted PhoX family phosphatase
MTEGEKHHQKIRVAHMEAIPNLCANKEVTHENHARGTRCAHGRTPWGNSHKNGYMKKKIIGIK